MQLVSLIVCQLDRSFCKLIKIDNEFWIKETFFVFQNQPSAWTSSGGHMSWSEVVFDWGPQVTSLSSFDSLWVAPWSVWLHGTPLQEIVLSVTRCNQPCKLTLYQMRGFDLKQMQKPQLQSDGQRMAKCKNSWLEAESLLSSHLCHHLACVPGQLILWDSVSSSGRCWLDRYGWTTISQVSALWFHE